LNQTVQFYLGEKIVEGLFTSLGESGSAVLNVDGAEKIFHSGEIS
jgi:hypothetical protein